MRHLILVSEATAIEIRFANRFSTKINLTIVRATRGFMEVNVIRTNRVATLSVHQMHFVSCTTTTLAAQRLSVYVHWAVSDAIAI